MYQFQSRVRYSEVDQNRKIKLLSIIDYFQDCSTFHSEDLGVGCSYLMENKLGWVLNYWQIDILDYAGLGDEITISTLPYEMKGFVGYRNFFMSNKEGEVLVKANSVWTLLDFEKNRPCKPDANMLASYKIEPKIDMEYLDRKIILPEGNEKICDSIEVKKHQIDTNGHVNNGQYVSMALDLAPDIEKVSRLRAEYKKSALLGDVIIPTVVTVENGCGVKLLDENSEVYAVVTFS